MKVFVFQCCTLGSPALLTFALHIVLINSLTLCAVVLHAFSLGAIALDIAFFRAFSSRPLLHAFRQQFLSWRFMIYTISWNISFCRDFSVSSTFCWVAAHLNWLCTTVFSLRSVTLRDVEILLSLFCRPVTCCYADGKKEAKKDWQQSVLLLFPLPRCRF